ncbi:serine hydroxymethyltransferase [Mesomycoplasma ovipneumoniae]|uniref:Probable serine hydroxymethyltransferase n=1 Tax=Mesomycoplasma ovipneumoniae TaxID=29562 RepID=A0AAJ2P4R2_9BACT|nr:serine hydroxymethyltransferase [Mesomycoplasma ovipneumoniae]MDW2861337.1 serine hydroxymethyltransferase [Mesomycoplasma ovipneumoniae]MDW2891777.1 serine hydroxymethyltransferase [Mesomycoplasma ovipneumoniae]MDW2893315.1 serine hydroxymethyltransferase [Mesomycoplasma ovipneumoniae]
MYKKINIKDQQISELINLESQRQNDQIELIASENYASEDVLSANGTSLSNKYGEGYPGKRYYGGCEFIDKIELIAIERAKQLFGTKFANVQPYSGSSANSAVFAALLKPGDKILGLDLSSGGHLTHGYKVNFSGIFYNGISYFLDKNEMLDYDEIEKIALETKPNLIICGYSAYSGLIDFARFRQIADKVGAYLLADIAHIAGLVATGVHPSPVGIAHIITSTTQKTLRGPRGGLILTDIEEIANKIDKIVFPGIQGGPLFNTIAAKAVAFNEALQPWFKDYCEQIVKSAAFFANEFAKKGARIVSGKTQNHLFIVDVKKTYDLTGKQAQILLESVNIITNKNTIPNDTLSPFVTSGIRFGTPAMTSRGFKEKEFAILAEIIDFVLKKKDLSPSEIEEIKLKIQELTKKFPVKSSYWI